MEPDMKLLFAALLLCLFTLPAFASQSYATDPAHPGRHYDCSQPGTVVAYENDQVVFLCGGITEQVKHGFFKDKQVVWRVVDPSKLLAKSAPGESLSTEQANAIVLAQLQAPFYDSSEKRMVHFLVGGIALDLVTTATLGYGSGTCSEAAPIASHLPGLSLALNTAVAVHSYRGAKRSPRYFTWSKDRSAWGLGGAHAIAGVHNLLTCG
jgi:hypothetical protein